MWDLDLCPVGPVRAPQGKILVTLDKVRAQSEPLTSGPIGPPVYMLITITITIGVFIENTIHAKV